MKFVALFVLFVSLGSQAAPAGAKKTLPFDKHVKAAQVEAKTGDKAKALLKKEEDCDDKAKKPVEIKPETISLGGNTGCSLDEAKP